MADTKPFEIAFQNITSLNFHPGGAHFVTGDSSGSLRRWNTIDGLQDGSWSISTKGKINAMAISADGRWIIGGGEKSKVIIWNAVTREIAVEVADHGLYALDISNDSTRFATVSISDNIVRIFGLPSGKKHLAIPPPPRSRSVIGVKFSPDASRIAITSSGASISIYDTSSTLTGDCLFQISVKEAACSQRTAWSLDSKQIFVASSGKITCVDASTHCQSEWNVNGGQPVSILTCGNFIAYSTDSSVSFWDSDSHGQMGKTINHHEHVNCIAISHDARRLACVHKWGIIMHNLEEIILGILYLPLIRVSDRAFKSWIQGGPAETEVILSDEISKRSNSTHDSLAICALIQVHLGEWRRALGTSEMSLKVKPSAIGLIARCIALVGAGEQEDACNKLDLVFWNCDPSDNNLLSVIKCILLFTCNKRKDAISRLRYFIETCDGQMKDMCLQVLGMIYLKERDYGNAAGTLCTVKSAFTTQDRGPLMSLFIIFNWNFENLKSIAWGHACEKLYVSGSVKEIGDTLLKMVGPLPENEKERSHGDILQEIITRSGKVMLLAWTGKSSTHNSCLPASPAAYMQTSPTPSSHTLQGEALRERIAELQAIVPLPDALITYGFLTRSQPVLFAQFRLLLPCIVFCVKTLRKEVNVYHAETIELGDVAFTTADSLPLEQLRQLVFVNPWIDHYRESHGVKHEDESGMESRTSSPDSDIDVELVHEPMVEEVPTPLNRGFGADAYMRALGLIAHLGQPFSALLLLKQQDGTYRRVAADQDIIVNGIKDYVLRNICVKVLEVR